MTINEKELEVERTMVRMGIDRYRAKIDAARVGRRQSETPSGKYLVREAVGDVQRALQTWLKTNRPAQGPCPVAHAYLSRSRAPLVAFVAIRSVLDSIGMQTGLAAAAYAIGTRLEEEDRHSRIRGAERKVWADLKRRMKGATHRRSKQKMANDVETKLNIPFEGWPKREKIASGVVMLELIEQATGLIEFVRIGTGRGRKQTMVVGSAGALAWYEKSVEAHEALFPFWLPTVVPPKHWTNPYDGGYHTDIAARTTLVKTRDKDVLRDMEAASVSGMPQFYAAVNAIQDTAWEINPDVHQVIMHLWETGSTAGGLPSRAHEPRPVYVEGGDVVEHKRALGKWYRARVESHSKMILAAKILFMARMFAEHSEFYFPHKADFRGRLYPVPFFLQPQGPSYARGLLRFKEGKALETEAQRAWFEVHGANCFGVDKASFDDRRAWVQANSSRIAAVHLDPLENRWWEEADKPWEFLAWALEYGEYLRTDSFVSHIPVAMDGSNNGLQIFSLLLRDKVGAEATNCTPSEKPRDIYQDVANKVQVDLRARALAGEDAAIKWLTFLGPAGMPRAATKRQVMTLPYGSTLHSCIHYTRDWYEETRKERGGETPFDRGYKPAVYLARLVWDAIGETVVAARAAMDWLQAISAVCAEHGLPVRWTAPSGFPVRQAYVNYTTRQIKTSVGESVRWTRYREDGAKIVAGKQKNGIAPNFVHSLDAAALVATVSTAVENGIHSFAMVHDSYGVLAADAPRMAGVLRHVYADLFSRPLLEHFRDEILKQVPEGTVVPPVPPSGDLDVEDLKRSLYFFA